MRGVTFLLARHTWSVNKLALEPHSLRGVLFSQSFSTVLQFGLRLLDFRQLLYVRETCIPDYFKVFPPRRILGMLG
jgi:hypothetical protein